MNMQLKPEDLQWFQDQVHKERDTILKCQENVLALAKEASEKMDEISARDGFDFREYNIDWKSGSMTPKGGSVCMDSLQH